MTFLALSYFIFCCSVTKLIQAARQTEEKSAALKTTLLNQLSVKIAQLNHNLEPRCHGFGLDPQLAAYSLFRLFIPQDKTGINITCVWSLCSINLCKIVVCFSEMCL